MNSSPECRPVEADLGLPEEDKNTVQALLDRLQQQAAETLRLNAALSARDATLKHAEAKIQALTLELAHLRRIRFGAKSEALNAEQRDLFQETLEADIAACEAEAEQAAPQSQPRAKRERAGRQPLPDHLPRIEHRHEPESCMCDQCGTALVKIGEDSGVNLARSTLAEWVGRIGVALQPLADRLAALLREQDVLHADETPVAQLDPGSGRTRRAYLWAYCSNVLNTGPPIVVFDYQISRAGAHAQHFLAHWKGALMVDGFGGYKALFARGVTELGCLAHARRKFFDLNAAQANAIAQEALARIAALYAIEAQGREMTVAARALLRREKSAPLLQSMHDWLLKTRISVAHGGGTAKAIDYSLSRWPALSRYATAGHLPIDNNPVENAIRPIRLGKRTGSSPVRNVRENVRPPFRVCWRQPNSTASIQRLGCAIP